jgi:hypothetical protein
MPDRTILQMKKQAGRGYSAKARVLFHESLNDSSRIKKRWSKQSTEVFPPNSVWGAWW